MLGTAAAVRAAGGMLTSVGALVAVGDSAAVGRALDVRFEHLAALPTALWTVTDCPLCPPAPRSTAPPS